MARYDAEAVLADLEAKLLERDGWGTRTILTELADLRARHRTAEGPLERLLRTNGDLRVVITTAGPTAPDDDGTTPIAARAAGPPSEARGGHDGRHDEHEQHAGA